MEAEQLLTIADAVVVAHNGRHLSDLETTILLGAIAEQTYEEIAEQAGYSISHVKRNIGPKLWQLLSQGLKEEVSKTNFRNALQRRASQTKAGVEQPSSMSQSARLAEAGTTAKAATETSLPIQPAISFHAPLPQIDWGESISVTGFRGRTTELTTLSQWIIQERCHLVALLGIGGIGKTALSVKLSQNIQHEFECVIW